jgi:perosamine synthetase
MPIRYPVSQPVLLGNEKSYVLDAIETTWISSNGPYINRFERALDEYLGLEGCLVTNNGTTALHLACLAMGLGPGDEVIVPALTYVASANAVAYCGARPVFADCDPGTWNLTVDSVRRAWTDRTVGVIAVHLYGLPCPADEIAELCRQRGAWLVEDCAESFGATIRGQATGSFGDASVFSFYGNKTISTGEGGMLWVRDTDARARARMLRGQGMDLNRRYWHPIIGYNYRMTNVAAAIGLAQIEMADHHLSERRRIAQRYRSRLEPLAARGAIQLPADVEGYASTYWLFSVVLRHADAESRERLMTLLAERHGIETRPFFVPMHHLPMYAAGQSLPEAEFLGARGINLPTYTGLADEDIDRICEALEAALAEVGIAGPAGGAA